MIWHWACPTLGEREAIRAPKTSRLTGFRKLCGFSWNAASHLQEIYEIILDYSDPR